jgi:phosphate starvation-inducible protein PhoH and related proteins
MIYMSNGLLRLAFSLVVMGCGCWAAKPRLGGDVKPVRLTPIGERQIEYCKLLGDKGVSVLAGVGPAGCGKTAFACHAAVRALSSGDVDRVVLTRPLVAVDEELGFLPGSMEQKMDPWIRPMMDIMTEFYSGADIRRLMDDGIIEIAPLAYMRGRTFRRAFLIADEMQNSSPNQMLMMLTRVGEGSRLVITGDLLQSDRSGANGLADFYSRVKSCDDPAIRYVNFGVDDVQRSSVVASILRLYEKPIRKSDDAAIIPLNQDVRWGL